MTKEEFIQEAALRLITARPNKLMCEIAELAENLANCVYGKEEETDTNPNFPKADEPIQNLFREIERIDDEIGRQRQEEYKVKYPNYKYTPKKFGYAERVRKVCLILNLKYVPNLLGFGRAAFVGRNTIGKTTIKAVDQALLNLYNIKSW